MTPRRLDPDTIHEKLRLMEQTLGHLDDLGQVDRGRLTAEPVVRAAVERWITVLVDLAVAVNLHVVAARLGRSAADYATSFHMAAEAGAIEQELAVRLAPSAGARNVLVHEYVAIDLDQLVIAVARARADYPEFVRQVAAFARASRN